MALFMLGLLAVLAVWLWGMGGITALERWAADGQRDAQNAMAGLLRRLKAGDAAALAGLMGFCFAYGFFHAAGPGHGKVLIGGYGLGRRVPMGRLAGLAVASSLAQAATAVGLVYAGVFLLDWSRERMVDTAEAWLAPLSYVLIGLVGLWLFLRGGRKLWAQRSRGGVMAGQGHQGHHSDDHAHDHRHDHGHDHGHDHSHDHHDHHHHADHDHHHHGADGAACSSCGHKHGPSIDDVAQVRSWRDALVLIGAVAVRPCTGALFLLILTWRMGIDAAGIAGAFVMGLGTASVTVLVAVLSVTARESALAQMAGGPATARALSLIEIAAGALVVLVAAQLFFGVI
jgi:ABC-type nickel/cobalt efflux system permease component RcnA